MKTNMVFVKGKAVGSVAKLANLGLSLAQLSPSLLYAIIINSAAIYVSLLPLNKLLIKF